MGASEPQEPAVLGAGSEAKLTSPGVHGRWHTLLAVHHG